MTNGHYADILIAEAIEYRNSDLMKKIVAELTGQEITPEVVTNVLGPYVEIIKKKLPEQAMKKAQSTYELFLPDAMESVHRNWHMHDFGKNVILNQDGADALLVSYINFSCIPMDLALYVSDLKETTTT